MSATSDPGSRPSRLGRYELITQIGSGGMADVQLALQRGPAGFEKLVVVKLIHDSLSTQKDFVDMLLDEARVAALVKHPNVVDIYDLGQADGRYFIAMEYLEGEPLLAVLRAGREGERLDALSSARLVSDTAEGLDAAHELRTMGGEPLQLVHHDISLGNIVVLYNGQVKLVDFGVAKATQTSHANKARVQGKFSYMAPEKLNGGMGDRRSDIWSLGVVMWEALTLKRLFKGNTELETMQQVLQLPIDAPSAINPDVPRALDRVVTRALERDPEKRYATAREMAADIEEILRQQGYGGRNDKIARWMQTTFDSHIAARKKLLSEVSSKGAASAAVLQAAFAEAPQLGNSGEHSGVFALKRKGAVAEGTPQHAPPSDSSPGSIDGDTVKLSDAEAAAIIASATAAPAPADPAPAAAAPAPAPAPPNQRMKALGLGLAIVLGGAVLGLGIRALRRTDEVPAAPAPTTAPVAAMLSDAAMGVEPDGPAEIVMEPDPAPPEVQMPVDRVSEPRPRPRPPSANELTKTGLNAFVRGDAKGALAQYRRAIAAEPSYAPAWRASGIAHEKLGDRRAAKTAFQRYLQLAPKAADAAQIQQRLENL